MGLEGTLTNLLKSFACSYKLFAFYISLGQMADQLQNKFPEFVETLERELYLSAESKVRSPAVE
jgi:hypothetical protein